MLGTSTRSTRSLGYGDAADYPAKLEWFRTELARELSRLDFTETD